MVISAMEKKKSGMGHKECQGWDITNLCRVDRESLRDLMGVRKPDRTVMYVGTSGQDGGVGRHGLPLLNYIKFTSKI